MCCGPNIKNARRANSSSVAVVDNPCQGLLWVRRPLDQKLTVLLGLAMDFNLLGNDPTAVTKILRAVVV